MNAPIAVRQTGVVYRLTLDRAPVGNAIDQDLADAFAAAVHRIAREPDPHVVVLAAAGGQFCAGGDVRAVAAAVDPAAYLHRLAATMHEALVALRESPHIVVAAVQGAAAGAGLALVLNADLVIASDAAVFLSAYAAVGLTPDCGVSYLLPRVVGPRRAAQLAIEGRVLTAAEALEWGLVTDVVAADDLDGAVDSLIARLSAGSMTAASRTLVLLKRDELDFASQLDAELDGLATQIALADTRERIDRFLTRSTTRERV